MHKPTLDDVSITPPAAVPLLESLGVLLCFCISAVESQISEFTTTFKRRP